MANEAIPADARARNAMLSSLQSDEGESHEQREEPASLDSGQQDAG